MAREDLDSRVWDLSPSLYTVSWKNDLPAAEARQVNSLSFLTKKNKELELLPEEQARNAFEGLDPEVQEGLKGFFGEKEYSKPRPTSLFGKGLEAVGDVFGAAGKVLDDWAQAPQRLYRATKTTIESGDPSKIFQDQTWTDIWDGNRVFDPERLAKVKSAYDPVTFNIAKMMSEGLSVGEIMSRLQTSGEYDRLAEFLDAKNIEAQDQLKEALSDIGTAKVSFGRDVFYDFFKVDPGDQGLNRKAFHVFSGIGDLSLLILLDPLTYVGTAGKAYTLMTLGLNKAIAVSGPARSAQLAKMFERGGVQNYFNRLGDALERSRSKDKAIAGQAERQIQRDFKEFSVEDIAVLKQTDVKDAKTALNFLEEGNNLISIFGGKGRTSQPILPSWGMVREVRANIRRATGRETGRVVSRAEYEEISRAAGIRIDDANGLAKFVTSTNSNDVNQRLGEVVVRQDNIASRFSRWFERNRLGRNPKIDISDAFAQQSSNMIYDFARIAMRKEFADVVRAAWLSATVGERRQMVQNMIEIVGTGLGMNATETGRKLLNQSIGAAKKEQYLPIIDNAKMVAAQPAMKEYIGDAGYSQLDRVANPEKANAVTYANISDEISMPNMVEFVNEINKARNIGLRSISGITNSKTIERVTDAWSFLTLFPRLGIRSAVEEFGFFGLTAPNRVLLNFLVGRKISRLQREMLSDKPGIRELGLVHGTIKKMFPTFTREERAALRIFNKDTSLKELNKLVKQKKLSQAEFDKIKEIKAAGFGALIEQKLATGIFRFTMNDTQKRILAEAAERGTFAHGIVLTENLGSGFNSAITQSNITSEAMNMINPTKFNLNTAEALKAYRAIGGYGEVAASHHPVYSATLWHAISRRVTSYSELLKSVLRHTDSNGKINVKAAIDDIVTYNNSPEMAAQKKKLLAANEGNLTDQQLAFNMLMDAIQPFMRKDYSLNMNLINKVRVVDDKGIPKLTMSKLKLEDLQAIPLEELPETLIGQQFVESWEGTGGLIRTIQDKGYEFMQRHVSLLAREPIFTAYYLYQRERLVKSGAEKTFFDDLMKESNMTEKAARKATADYFDNLGRQFAEERTLMFIDNPNVRSNIAFSSRNTARYYRATEDFWRRAGRTLYSEPNILLGALPIALVRLRLGYTGLEHSGFIHEDENGEKYFLFPVDDIMYEVLREPIKLITGKEPMIPMPIEFGGRIKMLTPSLDPESALPTLSGPLAAVGVTNFTRLFSGFLGENKQAFERALLGRYGVDRSLTDQLLPTSVKRIHSLLGDVEQNEQLLSAQFKAIAYAEANGMGLKPDATPAEKEEYKQNIQATARNILAVRTFLGFLPVNPVSPQMFTGKDVPAVIKEHSAVNFKGEFYKTYNEELGKDPENAWNNTIRNWQKVNPGILAYTVSETELGKVRSIRGTRQAARWIKANEKIFNKYPQAPAFWVPNAGEYDMQAYSFLRSEGFSVRKEFEDFMMEVNIAKARTAYNAEREQYEKAYEAEQSPGLRQLLREGWTERKQQLFLENPFLEEELNSFGGGREKKMQTLKDVRDFIAKGDAPPGLTTDKMKKIVELFDTYTVQIDSITGRTSNEVSYREELRNKAYSEMLDTAGMNKNAQEFIDVVIAPLLGVK